LGGSHFARDAGRLFDPAACRSAPAADLLRLRSEPTALLGRSKERSYRLGWQRLRCGLGLLRHSRLKRRHLDGEYGCTRDKDKDRHDKLRLIFRHDVIADAHKQFTDQRSRAGA
jgi:hypothetical protein